MAFGAIRRVMCSAMPLVMILDKAQGCDPGGFQNYNNYAYFFTGEYIKQVATAIAQLALAGHAIYKGNCGDFTVCKYSMAKYCQDFTELQAFSRKFGVTK